MSRLMLPEGYDAFLKSLKERVRSAQLRASLAVNRELVLLYWGIGRDILARQNEHGWGAKVIDRLRQDLRREFPEITGFSPRNLKYMRALAQVRHESIEKSAKCFGISSGCRRVYTTFAIKAEAVRDGDAELVEELFLFGVGRGDAAQADFPTVGGGQNDVGADQGAEQGQRLARREGRAFPSQQVFQRDPQRIAEKGHQDVGFGAPLQLVEDGPDRQRALQRPKRRFRFGELNVTFPQLFRLLRRQVACAAGRRLRGPAAKLCRSSTGLPFQRQRHRPSR